MLRLIFWARGIPSFSEVAFIVMASTRIDIHTSTLLMKLGANDILPKPIEKEASQRPLFHPETCYRSAREY